MGYAVTSNRIGSLGLNENAFQEPCICKTLDFYDKDELLHGYFTTVNGNKEFLLFLNNLKNKKLQVCLRNPLFVFITVYNPPQKNK